MYYRWQIQGVSGEGDGVLKPLSPKLLFHNMMLSHTFSKLWKTIYSSICINHYLFTKFNQYLSVTESKCNENGKFNISTANLALQQVV